MILFLIFGGKVRYNVPDVFALSGVLFGLIVANKGYWYYKKNRILYIYHVWYTKIRIDTRITECLL
ncbi:MAG: hypothetical protein BHV71_08990 [Bacteroides sp. 41_26]|nr:MAG: hypothetical protein BHV71_08990 [Bacteroides sp. 41_26]